MEAHQGQNSDCDFYDFFFTVLRKTWSVNAYGHISVTVILITLSRFSSLEDL